MATLRRIALVLLGAAFVALVLLGSRAAADDDPRADHDRVQGFVAPGTGELTGRVVDGNGDAVRNATVQIVTKRGTRTVTTDKDGFYRAQVGERATLVFVHGDVQISGSTVTSTMIDNAEAIEVKDALPPATLAKPLTDATFIPEYTSALMDSNAWARAWLLLEVSNTGVVARVKVLNPPGHELEPIAIRDAFKLKFEPARDRADKPIRTQVMWLYEWPSFWWMQENHYQRRRMPAAAYRVRCRGAGPTHDVYRNCAPPDLGAVIKAKWIERPRK